MVQSIKPLLRGHFHQAAFFIAIGACTLLVLKAYYGESFGATLVYSISLVTLLGVSALYHRLNWGPSARMVMRRLDHAAIYFLIAGTMTPVCLIALSEATGKRLLINVWIVAGIGMLLSLAFTKKPKWLNALLYFGASLVVVPYLPELARSLGKLDLSLTVAGGVAYAIGALVYAFKKPDFFPKIFGYHEVFHFLVVVGAVSHFFVIHSLV